MRNLTIAIFICFVVIVTKATASDYSDFWKGSQVAWNENASSLTNKLDKTVRIVWLGKVIETSIYTNRDGATSIELLCEQYPFVAPSPSALKEPFLVRERPQGHFVVTLSFPTLKKEEAREKILGQLKSPAWMLAGGNGEFVAKFKGIPAVYLHAEKALLSDEFKVQFDQYKRYRDIIDNFKDYSPKQREQAINDLKRNKSQDIEKHYLLGMLYFIQGVETMTSIAKSRKEKPRVGEVLKDPQVQRYYRLAGDEYDHVEKMEKGYKYIYCKYAELYRYSFNEKGFEKLTELIGKAESNERTKPCKSAIEDAAEDYTGRGFSNISRTIYKTAVKYWKPYPKYMLEGLGDIENVMKNLGEAKLWWKRCVDEAENKERKQRCSEKLKGSQ